MAPKLTVIGSKPTEPPPQSNSPGARLWRKVLHDNRHLNAAQKEMLKMICVAVDQADELHQCVDAEGVVLYTRGTPKAHPALAAELKLKR